MRQILCVYLPHWSTDRTKRRQRDLERRPVVLVEASGTKQIVAVACPVARSHGIEAGMTLAGARSRCAHVIGLPFDPGEDGRKLEALGRYLIRFSSEVAIEPPNAIFMEVGGSVRLFGGLEAILSRVSQTIARFHIAVCVAIAPTAGAAWALASCGRKTIAAESDLTAILSELPTEALRINPGISSMLHRVGIDTIGRLLALPREALPARFGMQLLQRLDQALGAVPEPLATLRPSSPIDAQIKFDEAVETLDTLWLALKELVGQVADELGRRGCGARCIRIILRPPYTPPVEKTVEFSLPSRDPVNLLRLLRLAMETIQSSEGFVAIRLEVTKHERLTEEQTRLTGQEEHDTPVELNHLIERLRARLSDGQVQRAELIESYVPERAFRCVPCGGSPPATPVGSIHLPPRPLRLLPSPVEIKVMVSPSEEREGHPMSFSNASGVHRLPVAVGPERISGVWWDGHARTRDYFDVEDETGRRFWIFRVLETWKWYLHGFFD